LRNGLFRDRRRVRVGVLDLLITEILAEFGSLFVLLTFEICVSILGPRVDRCGFLIERILSNTFSGERVVTGARNLALRNGIRDG